MAKTVFDKKKKKKKLTIHLVKWFELIIIIMVLINYVDEIKKVFISFEYLFSTSCEAKISLLVFISVYSKSRVRNLLIRKMLELVFVAV